MAAEVGACGEALILHRFVGKDERLAADVLAQKSGSAWTSLMSSTTMDLARLVSRSTRVRTFILWEPPRRVLLLGNAGLLADERLINLDTRRHLSRRAHQAGLHASLREYGEHETTAVL